MNRGLIQRARLVKTWNERCEKHPDHQMGMVTHNMIAARMQEEIDELRAILDEMIDEPRDLRVHPRASASESERKDRAREEAILIDNLTWFGIG